MNESANRTDYFSLAKEILNPSSIELKRLRAMDDAIMNYLGGKISESELESSLGKNPTKDMASVRGAP
jgi:hypothetical protein